MSELQELIRENMENDPEFAAEWERLEPEREVWRLIAEARSEQGLTQEELAERCGMKQTNLSRIERGKTSPTIDTLQRLANGLGKKLELRFV